MHRQYMQREKSLFSDSLFQTKNITIAVLENIQGFMEEGDTLSHCLFTNEYYTKKDSLILSARIEGIPIETIEVSLSKIKIVQCRDLKNKNSKHHKVILNLMHKNLYQVHSRLKKLTQETL